MKRTESGMPKRDVAKEAKDLRIFCCNLRRFADREITSLPFRDLHRWANILESFQDRVANLELRRDRKQERKTRR